MRKISRLICIGLLISAFSFVAFAQNPADVNVIGFSHGGKYFAFEEFGTGDDEDDKSPYSIIYIINVAKNSFAVAPLNADGFWYRKSTAPGIRNYGQTVKKRLKRFGIDERYLDQIITTDLMMDNLNTNNPTPRPRNGATLPHEMKFITDSFLERDPAMSDDFYPNFEVKLNTVLQPRENCSEFKRDMFSFELILNRNEKKVLTLQKPNKVCADAYGIEQICLYRNKLAVIVASLSKNSKGPDNRYSVVTGVFSDY
jgi:predicted secreted protein